MSEYHRTTRECSVSQLNPEILLAFKNYFQERDLGDLEAETIMCCETISNKKNADGLASIFNAQVDITVYTGVLFTSQWLIWARKGDRSGIFLTAASLNFISVRTYTSLFAKDTGLEVIGYLEGSNRPVRGYIGMGPESSTEKFCEAVSQAIERLNPPSKKIWPKWLGG